MVRMNQWWIAICISFSLPSHYITFGTSLSLSSLSHFFARSHFTSQFGVCWFHLMLLLLLLLLFNTISFGACLLIHTDLYHMFFSVFSICMHTHMNYVWAMLFFTLNIIHLPGVQMLILLFVRTHIYEQLFSDMEKERKCGMRCCQ